MELENGKYFAAKAADEIREFSASGGVFYVLGKYVIEELNGYVCGLAWENGVFKHIITKSLEKLKKMCDYQYVWDDINDIFPEIEDLLNGGGYVLLAAAPCQISRVRDLWGMRYKRLYLLDYTCEGVLKKDVFDSYIKEVFHNTIKEISFRKKDIYRWTYTLDIVFDDNIHITETLENSNLLKLLKNGLGLYDYCGGNCRYNTKKRKSDLTVGDFWSVGEFDQEKGTKLFDNAGVSMLSINTEKGKELVLSCKDKFAQIESLEYRDITYRTPFKTPKIVSCARQKEFERYYKEFGIKKAVKACINYQHDVALFGLWNGGNYGAIITAYALYEIIKDMGWDAVFIDTETAYGNRNNTMLKYITDRCSVSKKYADSLECYELNEMFDSFVIGSDQCWNYKLNQLYDDIFALRFVNDTKKRISYATSLGPISNLSTEEFGRYRDSFEKFDAISVREKEGADLCGKMVSKPVFHALDPILLRKIDKYKSEIQVAGIDYDGKKPYVLNYLLDIKPACMELVSKINDKTKIGKVITILGLDSTNPWDVEIDNVEDIKSIYEFIASFMYCDYVVTDSYHGMCLAILFNKPFKTILNRGRGSERFDSLAGILGLKEHLVESEDDINDYEIDWETVNQKLSCYREKSSHWLEEALNIHKDQSVSTDDFLREKIYRQRKIIVNLEERLNQYECIFDGTSCKNVSKDIFEYFSKRILPRSVMVIRGGGLHTEKLLKIISPMLRMKQVEIVVMDKVPKDIELQDECIPVIFPSREILLSADYIVISSWKYRKELKNEVDEYCKSNENEGDVIDIYETLEIDSSHPFYVNEMGKMCV